MRSLLHLSSLIASLVAFALARDFEIRHNAIPNKRHAHARIVRDLDDTRNHSAVLDGRELEKRFDGAKFTFYDAGLGSCGGYNTNADFIVALNAPQWSDKGHCGEMITIVYGGKTTTAQIMDLCPGCPWGGLDFSRGLFNFFSAESAGVIYGSWYFGAAAAPPAATTPTPTPTPTPTYAPAPTSTTNYVPPVTTTPTTTPLAYTPIPSSSTVLSSSSSTTPSISSTSSALNALISSSPNTTTSSPEGVLAQLNSLLVQFGGIVVVGSQSN